VAGVKAEEKNGERSARKRSERRLEEEEGVTTAGIPEGVGAGVVRVAGAARGAGAGARRERRGGAEVGRAGVGRRARGRHQLVRRRQG